MVFTNEERPTSFSDIVGQDETVSVLESLAEDPQRCPRSIIFRGPYGTGKTSASRVFARSLNCESDSSLVCGSCSSCRQPVLESSYYNEFDSTDLSLSNVREMKKEFQSQVTVCDKRVICFDEAHTAPTKTQSSLLKSLEDASNNVVFLFCTTDFDGLLDTIASRSLTLDFQLVDRADILELLNRIVKKRDIEISKQSLYHIVESANGHVRDAVLSLDLCDQIGDGDTFREEVRTPERNILELLVALKRGSEEDYREKIEILKSRILSTIQTTMESTLLKLIHCHVDLDFTSPYSDLIERVESLYSSELYKLLKAFSQDWFQNGFSSNESLEASLWALRELFASSVSSAKTNGQSGKKDNDLEKFRKAGA